MWNDIRDYTERMGGEMKGEGRGGGGEGKC